MRIFHLQHRKNKKLYHGGISLIEVLLAVAIFTLFVASLGTIGLSGMLMTSDAVERYRATLIAQESIAALRSIRTENFSLLTLGTHGLSFSGGKWQLTSTPDTIGELTRIVTISSSGIGRLLVRVSVEWPSRALGVGRIETQAFIHQLYGSRWLQTTVVDFEAGMLNGTRVGSDGDGAVLLAARGDWAKPSEFLSYDMSDIGTLSAMTEADGVLYLASSGAVAKPFTALDLADAGRGALSVLGSIDTGATVNAIAVSGNYVYLATDSDTRELVVLRRSDLLEVGSLNLAGTADALSLAATGTTLYLGRANSASFELYELNIANPEGGVPTVRTLNTPGRINTLQLSSAYLFVGSSDATELLVMRTSDLSLANSLDLPGGADVTSFALRETELYIARNQSASQEVVQVDVSDPIAVLTITDGADVSVAVRALAFGSDGRLYAATPLGNSEVIAYALPSLLTPAVYDVTQGAGANTVLPVGPYVYVGLTNNNPELVVLKGGSGEWEIPLLQSSVNLASAADGRSVAQSGNYAYVGTLASGSGGEFSIINIADTAFPLFVRSLEIGADVNAVALSGPYAYLATSDNARELIVVNIADPNNPFIVGAYNSVGNLDGAAVRVSGTSVVLGTRNNTAGSGREVYLLDAANPALPTLLAAMEVGSNVNGLVFLPGGYIGAATANDAKELMIINMNVPGSLTEVASYNTGGTTDALSIAFVNNTHIALGTEDNGTASDFFLFAFNSLSGAITFTGSLDLGGDNNGIAAAGNLVFVGNNQSGTGFTVVNAENPSVPQKIGTLLFGGVVNGVATDGLMAFIASADNNREFAIVAPSAISSLLHRQGWFISSPFDVGSTGVVWGGVDWTQTGTGTTSLQIRTSATEEGLVNAAWVGPGGLRGGAFTNSGSVITPDPLADGLEWIQYRAMLLGDGITTPALTDVAITYN